MAKGRALNGVFGKMLDPLLKTAKRSDAPTPTPKPHPQAPHPKPGRPPGTPPTRTDRIKEHISPRDLDAAKRELDGEVVARKADGTPWDHVGEVRDAQRGLQNQIGRLKRQLGRDDLTEAARAEAERELGEASRLLDHTRTYVPGTTNKP